MKKLTLLIIGMIMLALPVIALFSIDFSTKEITQDNFKETYFNISTNKTVICFEKGEKFLTISDNSYYEVYVKRQIVPEYDKFERRYSPITEVWDEYLIYNGICLDTDSIYEYKISLWQEDTNKDINISIDKFPNTKKSIEKKKIDITPIQ